MKWSQEGVIKPGTGMFTVERREEVDLLEFTEPNGYQKQKDQISGMIDWMGGDTIHQAREFTGFKSIG